jgi:flavodoxin
MFNAVFYYSKGGNSLKVAEFFSLPLLNVINNPNLENYNNYIIVCPTYGDEELPFEMEDFLINLKFKNKKYAICELGNRFGHEGEEGFGAASIIERVLEKLHWEKIDRISLDSVPDIDWEILRKWTEKLLII